jgi:alpha-L-fucosidase
MRLLLILVMVVTSIASNQISAQTTAPTTQADRIQWWRDAKFGLFVHWSVASLIGKEISWSRIGRWSKELGSPSVPPEEYDVLYKRFNPDKFDADAWMRMAKGAGMKYVVFVAKHHDGFCLWDTKLTDYSIMNSPYGKDICRQIADAAHKHGLRLGWYYSTWDWSHPDHLKDDNSKFNDYYHGHIRELLTNYGKVDILWFDHVAGNWSDYRYEELFDMIHKLQPGILVNDRAAKFVGKQTDKPTPQVAALVRGDFSTPERSIGRFRTDRPWETCLPMTTIPGSKGGGWSYRPEGHSRSYEECLTTLIRCVTGDGNLLLNVGPPPSGEIEAEQVAILGRMGQWLEKNGQSIYATRGGPFRSGAWGGSTYRGKTVFVHLLKWESDKFELPAIGAKVLSAKGLHGATVDLQQTGQRIELSMTPADRDPVDTIITLELDRSAAEIAPVAVEVP